MNRNCTKKWSKIFPWNDSMKHFRRATIFKTMWPGDMRHVRISDLWYSLNMHYKTDPVISPLQRYGWPRLLADYILSSFGVNYNNNEYIYIAPFPSYRTLLKALLGWLLSRSHIEINLFIRTFYKNLIGRSERSSSLIVYKSFYSFFCDSKFQSCK
jgi:hypothetical protein